MRRLLPSARFPVVGIALMLLLVGCPKRVRVNGQDLSEGEARNAAIADLEKLRAEAASKPPDEAAAAFEALAARYGDMDVAGEALYEAGVRWRQAKRPDRAVKDLGDFLLRFPMSPRSADGKYQLGLAQMESGKGRDALQTLGALYEKMTPAEKLEAAKHAALAAEAARQWADAARWHAEAATQAQDEGQRQAEVARATDIVDGKLPFFDVAKLKEELPAESPLQPAVVMKLARIYVHLHDYPNAEMMARDELARWPQGPYAEAARALVEKLARRASVNPKVIGLAVPLSGKFKAFGEAILHGVGMALDGGGYKIVVKDSRGEPDGAAAAIEELAMNDGAIAVIGGATNAEALRAATAAEELQMPFVSLSKVEGVTGVGPHVFRSMLTSSAQARAIAEFAFARRNMRSFAILFPNIPYGVELANAFWDEVESRKGEVRGAEVYEHDRTTFAPLVKSMVGRLYLDERSDYVQEMHEINQTEKDPFRRRKAIEKLRDHLDPAIDFDGLFIPDFAKNIALIAPALAVEDVVTNGCNKKEIERIKKTTGKKELKTVQLFGANGWDDPELYDKAGKYVECAIFVDGFFAGSGRAETKRFVEEHQKKFDRPPGILEASAYDAARMVRTVAEKQGAASREAIVSALAGLKGYKGATGDITFDQNREPVKSLFFLTVDNEGLREMNERELAATGAGGD